MKFTSTIALLASLLAVNASRVAWDSVYDNAGGSLSVVSCSDGPNGLLTKGYNVFKDLPTFPNIGAASAVAGWNSPNCGSCWNVTYQGKSILVTAVDRAGDGYTLSKTALNTLTNNQADWAGAVDGIAAEVPKALCGLK